jgi:chromosomal replication initiator protein
MPPKISKNVTEPVLNFIAERIKSKIDRLEYALGRVADFASLHGKVLKVPEVEVILRDFLRKEEELRTGTVQIPWAIAPTYDQISLMA